MSINFKRAIKVAFFIPFILIATVGCTEKPTIVFENQGNPLIRHMFTADPSARVFDGKLYLYTSHDRDDSDINAHFDMTDWHVFSTDNLTQWVDHGAFFSLNWHCFKNIF